jgi:hypothetical protein
VYAIEDTKANMLYFVDVEDKYDNMYVPRECFTVHLLDRDIVVFCRRMKLYISDFIPQNVVYATRAYTKANVEQAKTTYELI